MDDKLLDDFTRAYIEALLWSTHDDRNFDDHGDTLHPLKFPEMLDASFDWTDFDTESLQRIIDDCRKFQAENTLPEYRHPQYNDAAMSGHDFLLTRNGHGAGFWDRGLGDMGEKLTAAAKAYGEMDCGVGDDGKLYVI
jgi:hypothetical protein